MWKRLRSRLVTILRRNFVAGLLVFVPVGFTLFGVMWILDQLDHLVLPRIFRALGLETGPPRFAGVLVTIGAILFVGLLTRSFLGRWALSAWERVIDRVPIARSLYSVLKQFMQAVVGEGAYGESFQRVIIIEYPRRGLYSYAFVTGRGRAGGQRAAAEGLRLEHAQPDHGLLPAGPRERRDRHRPERGGGLPSDRLGGHRRAGTATGRPARRRHALAR